jgi:hypothetical protein
VPQFTIRTLLVVVAVVSAFLAGWLVGRFERASRAAAASSERGRLFHENRQLEDKVNLLSEQLEDCQAASK